MKTNTFNVDEPTCLDFFKTLNSNVDYTAVLYAEYPNIGNENELDNRTTEQEIKKAITKLKNGNICDFFLLS